MVCIPEESVADIFCQTFISNCLLFLIPRDGKEVIFLCSYEEMVCWRALGTKGQQDSDLAKDCECRAEGKGGYAFLSIASKAVYLYPVGFPV